MVFDIVIPVGPNDINFIKKQMTYTKKNIIGYRHIYLISADSSLEIPGCHLISEDIFPFSKNTVSNIHGKSPRNGWYYQQLLKLYAGRCIPNILDRYLVIDSDTVFLKKTQFIDTDNKCMYAFGSEHHKPYFIHLSKLDKEFTKIYKNKSGICHHMMFEQPILEELILRIEEKHNDTFYNVFLTNVNEIHKSGASEYELYFNYILKYHKDNIKIRPLRWKNASKIVHKDDVHYVSVHHYKRK